MMMMSGNRDAEVEMLKSQLQVARNEINNLRWVFVEGSFVSFLTQVTGTSGAIVFLILFCKQGSELYRVSQYVHKTCKRYKDD